MSYVQPEQMVVSSAGPSDGTWDDPDFSLIDDGLQPEPPLPLETLRSWEPWVRDFAAMKSAPTGYAMGAILAAAAGCLGKARLVRARQGWVAPPALWILLVGPPSAHKSPVLSAFISILREIEKEEEPGFENVRRAYETELLTAKEHAVAWEQRVKTAVKNDEVSPQKPTKADEPEKPEPPCLLVDTATIEAIGPVFRHNLRGVILARDELAGFVGNIGKYGGNGDAAFWLERYDGIGISNRTVKNGHIHATSALLSMVGGIQPERLKETLLDRVDDGFIARFIMIYPTVVKRKWITPVADMDVLKQALTRLRNLPVDIADGFIHPQILDLDSAAASYFADWWCENGDATDASVGYRAGVLGKAGGAILRIALVLEYLEWAIGDGAEPVGVTYASVVAAIALFEDYLLPSTCRALGGAKLDKEEMAAASLAKQIRHRRENVVNVKDVYREWGIPGLSKSREVKDAFERLSCAGLTRKAGGREGGTSGRQRADWEINTKLWTVR